MSAMTYESNSVFDDLVPPEHGQIWVNAIGTAVMSMDTLMEFFAEINGEIVRLSEWYSDTLKRWLE